MRIYTGKRERKGTFSVVWDIEALFQALQAWESLQCKHVAETQLT